MRTIRAWLGLDVGARRTERLVPFLRGVSMGALVGAAIAGSTIWRRARGGRGPKRR